MSTASPEVIAGAAMFVVFSAALYRLKESKSFIPVLFAALSYLPVSGIIPLNRHLSDSYMFAPLCGLCWAVSGIFDGNASRLKEKTAALKVSVFSLLAASLFVLSAASFHQCGIWRDSVSLWSYVMGKYPDSPQVCRNYGNAFMFSRRFEPGKAAAVYEKCVSALGNRDFFLKNLAIALFHSGRKAEAAALFEEYSMSHPGDRGVLKYMK
ncbi:MAG: hypothetical protein FJ088_01315 [Deltaproteobacteria bacterium]|nr:hypothetical protein [Deltaproteobacteria bacterium]